jgi:hypothetical protein
LRGGGGVPTTCPVAEKGPEIGVGGSARTALESQERLTLTPLNVLRNRRSEVRILSGALEKGLHTQAFLASPVSVADVGTPEGQPVRQRHPLSPTTGGEAKRLIVCHKPGEAEPDRTEREQRLRRIEARRG